MRVCRSLFLLLFLSVSGFAFGQATVGLSGGITVPATSASCADVLTAINNNWSGAQVPTPGLYVATSCDASPVAIGTTIFWTPYSTWTVTTLTVIAPAPASTPAAVTSTSPVYVLILGCAMVLCFGLGWNAGGQR